MDEQGRKNGESRWISIIITIIIAALGWFWSQLMTIQNALQEKAEKYEVQDRWSAAEMREYKAYIEARLKALEEKCGQGQARQRTDP